MNNDTLKSQLKGLPQRAGKRAEAQRWGTGQLEFLPEDLLPKINENVRDLVTRLAKMAQPIGGRIVQTIKFGTLGTVNWGGDSTILDSALENLDLEELADEILENALYSGVLDGIVRRTARDTVVIEALRGYTEPLFDGDSPTEEIGYIHAWLDNMKWTIRVYDFDTATLYEQKGLTEPEKFRLETANIIQGSDEYPDGAPQPRFLLVGRGKHGEPLGHITKLLPLIRGDWASQVRADRTEEATAFPQLAVKGAVKKGKNERSPGNILEVEENGDAWFLEPGNLSQIHAHHDRKLERLREDASMPGGFLGNDSPSGEALREANAKYISFCRYLATRLSRLLTALVRDYARANGLDDTISVNVNVNREYERQQEIDHIITLVDAKLMDWAAGVRAISVYVPDWSTPDVEAFIEREQALRLERSVQPSELGNVA